MVDDLRADLRSIENAIMAIESLAASTLGKPAVKASRSGASKKRASAGRRKIRLIFRRRKSQWRPVSPMTTEDQVMRQHDADPQLRVD